MYHRILVPLDGSPFAEQALPLALGLAERAGAALRLVHAHVLYALRDPAAWLPYDPGLDAACKEQEQAYLESVMARLAGVSSVVATGEVVEGLTADAILEEAHAWQADLIVMTTHGRGPLSRFWLGSVADELLRRAPVPTLLLRPQMALLELGRQPDLKHGLIPLDGTAPAERVLGPGVALGRLTQARYTLLRVIVPPLFPGHDPALTGWEAEGEAVCARLAAEAGAYLEGVAGRLRAQGCRVETRVVVGPQPAVTILDEAQAVGADYIALETRGRQGLKRLLLGSVADKVLRAANLPVLVHQGPASQPA